MEFGFLISGNRIVVDNIEIKPIWNLRDKIDKFYQTAPVSDGWIYPPITKATLASSEKGKFNNIAEMPARIFSIDPTHAITIYPYDSEKIKFLILAYGFLNGVYLNPAGHYCIRKTPYKIGELTGCLPMKGDLEKGIKLFSIFYDNADDQHRRLGFAILHWFLLGQTYEFEWDIFDSQYKVLDAIYKLSGIKSCPHAKRPVALAEKFNIQIPKWAVIDANTKSSSLSKTRNELVHEAKYGGHPIGYAYPEDNFRFELVRFNTKLILASFGLNSPFLKAEPENRFQFGWNFA